MMLLPVLHRLPIYVLLGALLSTSFARGQSVPAAAVVLEPGFTSLFDGKTFAGWEHAGNWVIEDGAFYRQRRGGSLTYTAATVPDNFELRFQWKVSEGCNSGLYYRPGQVEYQVLDNVHSPYGENARQAAGSLFFCMAPREDATKPLGQWNTGRVICDGTVIEHWVNGKRVLSFDYADPKWAWYVDLLAVRGGDLTGRGGQLWLQDHGQDVWFRNLRWRELGEDDVVQADPTFEPLPVTGEALAKEEARVARMRAARQEKALRPNIIWIMADDLGWGDLGCYGSSRIATPHLDRLAAEGMRFTDAHSPATICSPTRYGVLTGTDPSRRYHTSHVLFNGEPLMIGPSEATVASMLSAAGYATAVVGKWHLGLGDAMPRDLNHPGRGANEIGFGYSFLVADGHNMFPRYYLENGSPWGAAAKVDFASRLTRIDRLGYRLLEHRPAAEPWPDFRPDEQIGATLVEQAVSWLEQVVTGRNTDPGSEPGKGAPVKPSAPENSPPFFLYLPTCAIHSPQRPDPRFAGKSDVGPHGDFVMEFDWTTGEILAAIDRLGIAEDTLVFVTSDNGGLPGTEKRGHSSSGPWRGHKGSAWEGGHRIPLIVRWPEKIKAGTVSGALFSLSDLAATASSLAGGFLSPQSARDSIDQAAVLLGQQTTARDSLVITTRGCAEIVLREGAHKLTLETSSGVAHYCHLATDPGEKSPQNLEHAPELASDMLERLHRYFSQGASRSQAISRPSSVNALFQEKESRNRQLEKRHAAATDNGY